MRRMDSRFAPDVAGPSGSKFSASHVLNFVRRELFQQLLGYVQGLPGDRLPGHERGGHQRPNAPSFRAQQGQELLGHDLQAGHGAPHRALLMAHVSTVSARLTAQVELRARSAVPTASQRRQHSTLRRHERALQQRLPTAPAARAASWRTSPHCERPARPSLKLRPRNLSSTRPETLLRRTGPERHRAGGENDWWNKAPFQTSQTTTPFTPQNLNALPPPRGQALGQKPQIPARP